MKINRKNIPMNRFLKEDGTFEAIPYSYTIRVTNNGNNMMGINYRIREDVPQEHQGEVVDYSDSYQDTELGERYINALIVNADISSQELPDKQEFTLAKIAQALMGKPVRITNKRQPSYRDPNKMENNIAYTEPSQAPSVAPEELKNIKGDVSSNRSGSSRPMNTVPSGDPFANASSNVNVSDDDLPF